MIFFFQSVSKNQYILFSGACTGNDDDDADPDGEDDDDDCGVINHV